MDPLLVAVLKALATVGGLGLLVYGFRRAVSGAKKAGRSGAGELIVGILLFVGAVIVPAPPREVPTETRKLKREQDASGDPP